MPLHTISTCAHRGCHRMQKPHSTLGLCVIHQRKADKILSVPPRGRVSFSVYDDGGSLHVASCDLPA